MAMTQSRNKANSRDRLDGEGCPEPSAVAAFIDGRLDGEARLKMLAHMDGCARCYEWISGSLHFLNEHPEEQAQDPASEGNNALSSEYRKDNSKRQGGEGAVKPFFRQWPFLASAGVLASAACWFLVFDLGFISHSKPGINIGEIEDTEGQRLAHSAMIALAKGGVLLTRFKLPLAIDDEIETSFSPLRSSQPRLQIEKEEVRQAVSYFEKNLLKNPGDIRARIHLVALHLLAQNDPQAYTESLGLAKSKYPEARCAAILAKYAYAMDRAPLEWDTAVQEMRELYLANPQSAMIAYNYGTLLLESEVREEEYREPWTRFLELEPEGPFADRVRQFLN